MHCRKSRKYSKDKKKVKVHLLNMLSYNDYHFSILLSAPLIYVFAYKIVYYFIKFNFIKI